MVRPAAGLASQDHLSQSLAGPRDSFSTQSTPVTCGACSAGRPPRCRARGRGSFQNGLHSHAFLYPGRRGSAAGPRRVGGGMRIALPASSSRGAAAGA